MRTPSSPTWTWTGLFLGPFLVALALSALSGCSDDLGALGASCSDGGDCASGRCYQSTCVDPGATRADGLTLEIVMSYGLSLDGDDTDGDGLSDILELGGDAAAPVGLDEDGDGLIDALDSAIADADADCIKDQFDPHNTLAETDLAVVAQLACPREGVCADPSATISASCQVVANGAVQAQLVCTVSGPVAFEEGTEVSCDGLDNDCDGRVDEGLTYLPPGGGDAVALGATCRGVGACKAATGVVECRADGGVTCSVNADGSAPAGVPVDVACDGVDNDCDGVIDGGIGWTDPKTGSLLSVGQPCDGRGACGVGVVECVPGLEAAVCSTEPGGSVNQSAAELCNNLDDDCDGDTDEGYAWTDALSGASFAVGASCGVGRCEGSVVSCLTGKAACVHPSYTPKAETCNQLDDDCDGATDEPEDLLPLCPTAGVCAELDWAGASCEGVALSCLSDDPRYEPGEELSCDGLDNDCDGLTDEGLASPSGLLLGDMCGGQGACAGLSGQIVCDPEPAEGEPPGVVCSADLEGQPESCNGIDDDCDGQSDEPDMSQPGGGVCAVEGVCGQYADVAPSCEGAAWICAYTAAPGWEASELSCDGKDNDCDGLVDEGLPKSFTWQTQVVGASQPPSRAEWILVGAPGGPILVGGYAHGHDGPVPLRDAWQLDPGEMRWSPLPPLPSVEAARAAHAMTFHAQLEVVLVHGGYVGQLEWAEAGLPAIYGQPAQDLWALDLATNTWKLVGQDASAVGMQPPTRAYHSLTALPTSDVLLHGGLGTDDLPDTLVGTLTKSEGGSLMMLWDEAPAQAPERAGHVALVAEAQGKLYLVGGFVPGDPEGPPPAFVVEADLSLTGQWSMLGTGSNQPLSRLRPAAAVDAERLVVFGGRAPGAGPSTKVVAEGFGYVLPDGPWKPLTTAGDNSASPPPTAGATLFAAGEASQPSFELVGGASGAGMPHGASWSWTPGAGGGWSEPTAWWGPSPRIGARVVLEPGGGTLWLLSGRRQVGETVAPLQDAWRWTPTQMSQPGSLVEVVAPRPPGAPLDGYRPALLGAGAVWDVVGKRVLLMGGMSAVTGAPSKQLWALDGAGFSKLESQGEAPTAVGAVFSRAPGATSPLLVGSGGAWTGGINPGAPGDPSASEPIFPDVHTLDPSTLTWTATWADDTPLRRIAGGVSAEGQLRLFTLDLEGLPAMWAFDADAGWQPLWSSPLPYADIVAYAHDPWGDQTLLALAQDGDAPPVLAVARYSTGELLVAPMSVALPAYLFDAAMATHPSLGVFGFGGQTGAGVTGAGVGLFTQTCK